MTGSQRRRSIGLLGALGPVSFIAAWLVAGQITEVDYSPVDDAISRLAAAGSDVRWLMNVGFVTFGVLGFAVATTLWRLGAAGAGASAAITSLATFGVAAAPLGFSETLDRWHGFAAIVGYLALVATPVLAHRTLRSQHESLARYGLVMSGVAVACLVLMTTPLPTGLFQRIGLTAVDSWIAFVGLWYALAD